MVIEEDNAYPFSTTNRPKSQQKEEKLEVSQILEQLPILKELIKRLDDRIAFYNSNESIKVDISTDPSTFQKIHAANSMTIDNLKRERAWVLSKIDKLR